MMSQLLHRVFQKGLIKPAEDWLNNGLPHSRGWQVNMGAAHVFIAAR
jgi:hypothetical protein